jgi:hypothetical protein
MVTRVAIVGALAVVMALSTASAQDTRSDDRTVSLQLEREATPRPIVPPQGDRGAARDAGSAAAEYEQTQRDETLMRALPRPTFRRPDLGYDVISGIQQRNIRRK